MDTDSYSSLSRVHVVAAIVWHPLKKDQFLIAQRQQGKHLQGYWEFPGGKLEAGETPSQALKRELFEEIGIICFDTQPFMQVSHDYDDRRILLDVWEVSGFDGRVEACEGQQICWISIDQMSDYAFPQADMPVIDAIASSKRAKTECPA